MAKLTRVQQKIFAIDAQVEEVGVFGSEGEGTPTNSKDPEAIMSLPAFGEGWLGAILGALNPTLEDRNGLDLVITRQLAYLYQQGIAEWDALTPYFINSYINYNGMIYKSIADDNIGHAPTDAGYWLVYGQSSRTVTVTGNVTLNDDIVRVDNAAAVILTLPTIATSKNKKYTFKNVGGWPCKIQANGAELMDGVNNSDLLESNPLNVQYGSMTVYNNGTTWDVL